MTMRCIDYMRLNLEIVTKKIDGAGIVREYPADFCRRENHVFRPLDPKERVDSGRVAQIEFLARARQQIFEPS